VKNVATTLEPNDYVVVPHVAILDTFRMTNGDGSFVADITDGFLDKLIEHMNGREALTGDLCPLVIGHTQDGLPEIDQPPLVGYARNWHKGVLGDTGRSCAFFDAWVLKSQVELVRKFPRRSGEVWANRYEIDPISLLGATTPARDLGLLRLSREGSFTYTAPGETVMPEEKTDDKPKADPKESGAAKGLEGKIDQLLSMMTQCLEMCAPGAKAQGGAPAPGADQQMGDEDYEKLMQELMAGQDGDGGDKPEPRTEDKPTKTEGPAKLSRAEQRVAELEAEVARMQVKDKLVQLSRKGHAADPEDSALIEDLVAMDPLMRQRQLDRIASTPVAPGHGATHLSRALGESSTGAKRLMDRETMTRLSRKASSERKSFEQVAAEEGYDLTTV